MTLTRRDFIKTSVAAGAASSALVVAFNPTARCWIGTGQAKESAFDKLPPLSGQLLLDDQSRDHAADDYGHYIHHRPVAVLKPGSVQDVVEMVKFANRHSLRIAMRGQGHSTHGQAQVESGIVIDSSPLNAVRIIDSEKLDTQPGALWISVLETANAIGKRPPVVVDYSVSILSVGGTLSVGGFDSTSWNSGFQVDHVLELDVITGAGDLMTCSPSRNADLFNLVLHGLGQCGIIVRARLPLVPAPTNVTTFRLTHTDLAAYISDCQTVVTDRRFDTLIGGTNPKSAAGDPWTFNLEAGSFDAPPAPKPDPARLLAGLKHTTFTTKAQTWMQYQRRYDDFVEGAKSNGSWFRPHPYIVLFVPASGILAYMQKLLATPLEFSWATPWFYPLNTNRMTRPLTRMPNETIAFLVNLHRSAPEGFRQADVDAMIATNRKLYERARDMGGKRHTIASIPFSQQDWIEHYGQPVFQMLRDGKKRFDPNSVLTPGQDIFT